MSAVARPSPYRLHRFSSGSSARREERDEHRVTKALRPNRLSCQASEGRAGGQRTTKTPFDLQAVHRSGLSLFPWVAGGQTWAEHFSEALGHVIWLWSIELVRRDVRNRITHQPDPWVPLDAEPAR